MNGFGNMPTTLRVTGISHGLAGAPAVPGAKNSALPALVAAALAPGPVTVRGVPRVTDVRTLVAILRHLGSDVDISGAVTTVGPRRVTRADIPPELSRRLRGSVYALAVPAAVLGRATSGPVGGDHLSDTFARRGSLTPHARAFAGLGLRLRRSGSGWVVDGGPVRPGEFDVDDQGVSATALAAILAATAEGRSVVRGASREVEVDDTLAVLSALGADAARDGSTLVVHGPMSDRPAEIQIPPDRIHAGTLAIAAAVTGGTLDLPAAVADRMTATFDALCDFGIDATRQATGNIRVSGPVRRAATVTADMYPAFAADLLPPIAVLAAQAPGRSTLVDRVYQRRDGHLAGLRAMGARVSVHDDRITVTGPTRWRPGRVRGDGIRETAALVLAALAAPGTTRIDGAEALDRGYEDLLRDIGELAGPQPSDNGERGE